MRVVDTGAVASSFCWLFGITQYPLRDVRVTVTSAPATGRLEVRADPFDSEQHFWLTAEGRAPALLCKRGVRRAFGFVPRPGERFNVTVTELP